MSYYSHYGVLLASAVVLMTHTDDVFADNGFAMTLPDPKVSQDAASDPPTLNDDNQVKRHYRNHNKITSDDDNFEDRLLGTGFESVLDTAGQKTKMIVGAAEPKTTFAQQQKVDEHFNRLMPEGVESLNFGTKGFQDWDRYVNKLYAKSPGDADVAVIKTLMSYVDDARLTQMLLAAEKVEKTKAIAARLIEAQFKYWLAMKKNAEDVFILLKLDEKTMDMLLTDPMMPTWLSYVDKLDKKQLENAWPAILKEDTLPQMLIAAEKVEETKAIAARLMEAQFKYWLAMEKNAEDVFTLLKLYARVNQYSTSIQIMDPLMKMWISYARKWDEKRTAIHVWSTLKSHVKEEDALVKMFIRAEQVEETKALAKELIQEQIIYWTSEKKNARLVFKNLKLHERTELLLTDPMMKVWLSFVSIAYKDNPLESMWEVLGINVREEVRIKMLLESEKIEETKDLATDLLNQQFFKWDIDERRADDIFTLLQLHDKTDMFLRDSLVKRWISYVGIVNKHEETKTIWDTLKIHFEEDVIAKIIFEGKKDHLARGVAQKLEVMQFIDWVTSKTSADKVYKLVKVGSEKGNPFEEPGFNIWASYVVRINKKSPYEILMVELKARYNDDRALAELLAVEKARDGLDSIEHLQKLQYQDWLDRQKTADDIFKLLKLHERGNKIFEDKLWHTWVSYLAKLAEQTGERQETLMYSVLKKYNNEKDMMKLIQTARKNRDTEPIAATLLSEKWQDEQKSGIGTFKDWLRSYLP